MQAYYANFALLMKRLGSGNYDGIQGFGKTALVNIEPDFSGGYAMQAVNNNGVCFGFCSGQGNDPSLLNASASTLASCPEGSGSSAANGTTKCGAERSPAASGSTR